MSLRKESQNPVVHIDGHLGLKAQFQHVQILLAFPDCKITLSDPFLKKFLLGILDNLHGLNPFHTGS